jgi:hypothetical protein
MKMKKILCAIALLAGLSSCNGLLNTDPPIVDWAPVVVYIDAVDTQGNSIITDGMPGMSLTFQGKTYEAKTEKQAWEDAHAQTKAYLARMYGLFTRKYEDEDGDSRYYLVFGEIDGAADMDEDIVLHWPNGGVDTIHYHCSDHQESPVIRCKRTWKLNGEEHEGPVFKFTFTE